MSADSERKLGAESIHISRSGLRSGPPDNPPEAKVTKINQGDCYVTSNGDEILSTVLGSCVSACIRDPSVGISGMNHFMLPESDTGSWGGRINTENSFSMRYGNFAMEQLINQILSLGGRRERLEIKVFGGGNVTAHGFGIGHKNANFVEQYLKVEGLQISASNLRGKYPRMIRYAAGSGAVFVKLLSKSHGSSIQHSEYQRRIRIRDANASGTIELFD